MWLAVQHEVDKSLVRCCRCHPVCPVSWMECPPRWRGMVCMRGARQVPRILPKPSRARHNARLGLGRALRGSAHTIWYHSTVIRAGVAWAMSSLGNGPPCRHGRRARKQDDSWVDNIIAAGLSLGQAIESPASPAPGALHSRLGLLECSPNP